jgi:hypothetical protein
MRGSALAQRYLCPKRLIPPVYFYLQH